MGREKHTRFGNKNLKYEVVWSIKTAKYLCIICENCNVLQILLNYYVQIIVL